MSIAPLAVHSFSVAGSSQVPVVLLHGIASSGAEDFAGWPDALGRLGRTAHVIDLPGHGDSPAIGSVDDALSGRVVAAIDDAISATGAAQVDVVAYSLGARLTWDLASAGTVAVRRLVLGGISPFEPFTDLDLAELRAVAAGDRQPASRLTGMMAGMVTAPGVDSASLLNLIGGLAAEPFDPSANAPKVPTLFIAGETDAMTGGIENLVAAVPGSRLMRVPGDHVGALHSPEFRAAAIEFLA